MSNWWRGCRGDIDPRAGYDSAGLGGSMRRRTFIAGLIGAAAFPRLAHAQRNGKPPVIGFVAANAEQIDRPRIELFMRGLGELGWTEGKTIVLESRWSDGVAQRVGEFAAELA